MEKVEDGVEKPELEGNKKTNPDPKGQRAI